MNHQRNERCYPLVALRGLTIFPHMTLHFDAGRDKSVAALEAAMEKEQLCILVAQKDARQPEIGPEDLEAVGTLARVKQLAKLPGDSVRALVEGLARVRIGPFVETEPFFEVEFELMPSVNEPSDELAEAFSRELIAAYDRFSRSAGKASADVMLALLGEGSVSALCDLIAANTLVKGEDKQAVLEETDVQARANLLLSIMHRETQIKKLEGSIQQKVRKAIEKGQREYYLREQIKVIRTELGEDESPEAEAEELLAKLKKLELEEEISDKIAKEIKRYATLPQGSHETPVLRTWIDWALGLPWGVYSQDRFDIAKARDILERDHYGLEKVKERMLEHLAVCKLKRDPAGTILCLVGPPGVGKTSIASSIAEAVGRKFVRMSLGGVRDEAEIRGHRKTYIGAIPGRFIAAMKQAGTMNPLILLDEIDKLGADHRGDPASAMLEVLDGAQNSTFRDHYLELPFDLSNVMFVTTANTTDTIPRPLLDRMEVVQLSSYTEDEKVQIAKRHLLPKQIAEHALPPKTLSVPDETLRQVILGYTREAGVRTLERRLAEICRKAAVQVVGENKKRIAVSPKKLQHFLGTPRYRRELADLSDRVGVVTGLAWTAVGGETLCIECEILPGSGHLELTGQLGDVMRESARAAFTYTRAHAAQWGIAPDFDKKHDIHIHIPEGAIPKDGPSAGISMATALISALSGVPVRGDVAMTGEITLRGKVLPIGGLKEKSIAAQREGIKTIVMPEENRVDLQEIPDVVKESVKLVFCKDLGSVLKAALLYKPKPYVAPPEGEKRDDAAPNGEAAILPGQHDRDIVGLRS